MTIRNSAVMEYLDLTVGRMIELANEYMSPSHLRNMERGSGMELTGMGRKTNIGGGGTGVAVIEREGMGWRKSGGVADFGDRASELHSRCCCCCSPPRLRVAPHSWDGERASSLLLRKPIIIHP